MSDTLPTDSTPDTPATEAPAPAPAPAPATPAATEAPVTPAATEAPATPAVAATATPAEAPTGTDWATLREKYANGDDKMSKRLARYSSTEAALDALVAAQNKIASGALKAPLGDTATPEEVKAWREENGIPTEPTGYDLTGIQLHDDGTTTSEFLKVAHEANMTPAQVRAAAAWQSAQVEAQMDARREADNQIREINDEALRQEWGTEYKLNQNLIVGLLDTAPEGVKDQFIGGRLADGTPIASDAKTLRWLASLAREVNPVATVVPGSGTNAAQAIESEMATMQKMMGDRNSEYWKGPNAEKMQARFRDLVAVQQKIK